MLQSLAFLLQIGAACEMDEYIYLIQLILRFKLQYSIREGSHPFSAAPAFLYAVQHILIVAAILSIVYTLPIPCPPDFLSMTILYFIRK